VRLTLFSLFLVEVSIGQWKEGTDGIKYIRDSSYIKFLGSAIGKFIKKSNIKKSNIKKRIYFTE
jgi:hypothetical protein